MITPQATTATCPASARSPPASWRCPATRVVHVTLGRPGALARRLRADRRAPARAEAGAHRAVRHRAAQPRAAFPSPASTTSTRATASCWPSGTSWSARTTRSRARTWRPVVAAPAEPSLYAFAYTVTGAHAHADLRGGGRRRDGRSGARTRGIVRHGETSPDGDAREGAARDGRRCRRGWHALGGEWSRVTAIEVYTARSPSTGCSTTSCAPAGAAAIHGLRWFPSRPPDPGSRVRDGSARCRPRARPLTQRISRASADQPRDHVR